MQNDVQQAAHEGPESARARPWAWAICWLMFASTALNYMDRQSIALVGPQIRRQFGLDFEGFGWIMTAFGLAYALFQLPAGLIVDRLDVRRVYAGAVAFWSLAAIVTAFSPTLGVLIACRALLGVGESFNWPCALRVTREILPARDRSLGNGIFNSGAAVGAVLTPLAVPLLTKLVGWQMAFVTIGALGFVWVIVWRRFMTSAAPLGTTTTSANSSTRMGARARVGLAGLALLSVGIAAAGAILPVRVPARLDRVRPTGEARIQEWLVQPDARVSRDQALAIVAVGGDRFELRSTTEGKFVSASIAAGALFREGATVYVLDDGAGPLNVHADWLRPVTPPVLVEWRKASGTEVRRGEVVARVRGERGSTGDVVAPFSGRLLHEGRAPTGPTAMELEVAGFAPQGWGLPAIWWAVATLMIGLLILVRWLPERELGGGWLASLGQMTRLRRFWVLVVVSCTINVAWHFLVNWLPTYLQSDRQMSYLLGGVTAALPFLAADAGNLGGGALSRWLVGRGIDPARARWLVMAGCAALVACGALVGAVPLGSTSGVVVIALLCLMALGAAAFMANYFAFCQDVSARLTGVVVGYLGGLGNLVAAGFNPVAGRIKDATGSFAAVFVFVGLVPFVGLFALAIGWGKEPQQDVQAT